MGSKSEYIGKSSFKRLLQCEKLFYLNNHHPELKGRIDSTRLILFSKKNGVKEAFERAYPAAVNVKSIEHDRDLRYEVTSDYLAKEKELINAVFRLQSFVVNVDRMAINRGRWDIYFLRNSVRVSRVTIKDAAFAFCILKNLGYKINNVYITILNKSYRRRDNLVPSRLFKSVWINNKVEELEEEVQQALKLIENSADSTSIPEVSIGDHCFYPYKCDFISHCWKKKDGEKSLFDLQSVSKKNLISQWLNGNQYINDLRDISDFDPAVQFQIKALQNGVEIIDKLKLGAFYDKIKYPLFFMDIEAFQPAIPLYENDSPYNQIPFLYSIRKLDEDGGNVLYDFAANVGEDQRLEMTNKMIEALEEEGSIIVWDSSSEGELLKAMRKGARSNGQMIDKLFSRLVDLSEPFRELAYYHPEFLGSHSLKAVQPILAPGVIYDKATVKNGAMASVAYQNLHFDNENSEAVIASLKEYCDIDTMAMQEIYLALLLNPDYALEHRDDK